MKHKDYKAPVTLGNRVIPLNSNNNDGIKYKVSTINENKLADELNAEGQLGFQLSQILEKINPNAQSDFSGYKVLLVRK